MIIYANGVELGFSRLSDRNAEVAWRGTSSLAIGSQLRVADQIWRITKIEPSAYVRGVTVASLWLIS